MAHGKNTRNARQLRHDRVRRKVLGTREKPRLCVFRSLKHIYAQVLDDGAGHTIACASTLEGSIRSDIETKSKVEAARLVGAAVAGRALEKGVKRVVFDRGGYKFHGRVKALADSARETGLEF